MTGKERSIGEQIREARETAGLTQIELGEKAGLPQSHVSAIESGKSEPSTPVLRRLADALQATWSYDGGGRMTFRRRHK